MVLLSTMWRASMKEEDAAVKLLGIPGSLRRASFSSSLIRLLAERVDRDTIVELFDLSEVPLYNEDLDVDPRPEAVDALNRAIAESDEVLFVTP